MKRSAIKADLFAGDRQREKPDTLGGPVEFLERHVDLAPLAAAADRVAPLPTSENGDDRPPCLTEALCVPVASSSGSCATFLTNRSNTNSWTG